MAHYLIDTCILITGDRDLVLQLYSLKNESCNDKNIFADKISGSTSQRVGLDACLFQL